MKNRLENEIAKHAQSLEKAVDNAIGSRSRVRRAFKQIPVKPGAGIGPISGHHAPTSAFKATSRSQRVTSQVNRKTAKPIKVRDLSDDATSFVRQTLQHEDEYLFGELLAAEKNRTKWAADWPAAIRAHLAKSARFSSPQVLVVVENPGVPHPDPNHVADLKTLNVTVLPVPDSVAATHGGVVGLLLEGNSDGAVLRIEQDWQLQWERHPTKTDEVHLVMEAFWLSAVTKKTVHVFEA